MKLGGKFLGICPARSSRVHDPRATPACMISELYKYRACQNTAELVKIYSDIEHQNIQ